MPELEISELRWDEIDEVRRMQALVWQDHFLKEKGREVPLLYRSRKNIGYYMEKDGGACFVARNADGIIGSIICHVWGKIGWFGPFEVHHRLQGRGIGKALVKRAIGFLDSKQCTTIGLETMMASSRNVAFYTRAGFSPNRISYVLYKDLGSPHRSGREYSEPRDIAETDLPELKNSWNHINPGLNYSAELDATGKFELGDSVIFDGGGQFPNHALLHTYELIDESQNSLVKLLVAEKKETALSMLTWCEERSRQLGKRGIFLRYYQGTGLPLNDLLMEGYVLNGTLVRMQVKGADEITRLVHISCWSG